MAGSLVDSMLLGAPAAGEEAALLAAVMAGGPMPVDYATDEDLASAEEPRWPPAGLLDEVEPGPLLASLARRDATWRRAASGSGGGGAGGLPVAVVGGGGGGGGDDTSWWSGARAWRGVAPEGEQVSAESVSAQLMAAVEVGCALDLAPATARGRVGFARGPGAAAGDPGSRLAPG